MMTMEVVSSGDALARARGTVLLAWVQGTLAMGVRITYLLVPCGYQWSLLADALLAVSSKKIY